MVLDFSSKFCQGDNDAIQVFGFVFVFVFFRETQLTSSAFSIPIYHITIIKNNIKLIFIEKLVCQAQF